MTPCEVWTGATTWDGYAVRGGVYMHRAAYEASVGPIPEGLQLDHLCRNPTCINVDHLEPVTPAENSRRARRPGLVRGVECPKCEVDDWYDDRRTPGSFQCRACTRRRSLARHRARRG